VRIIGLTGGIASGKSTVANMLRALGARVVDADVIARRVVEPGQPAWEEIVAWLGRDILRPDGGLDRKKLGDLVFADGEARARLEMITHPRIAAAVEQALAEAEAEGLAAAVVDAPLLYEAGWDAKVDEVWVVAADDESQLRRLTARDGLTPEEAKARVAAQMALAEKRRRADVVIDNSSDLERTRREVRRAWRRVTDPARH